MHLDEPVKVGLTARDRNLSDHQQSRIPRLAGRHRDLHISPGDRPRLNLILNLDGDSVRWYDGVPQGFRESVDARVSGFHRGRLEDG